ncbi:MAG: PilZ domain-containing protein [Acidiferrobacterales bacterium]
MGTGNHTQGARSQVRREKSLDVLVAVPNRPLMTLQTGNITEKGVYLLAGNRPLPEIGSEVVLTLEAFLLSSEAAAMRARVVHKTSKGMGVELLGPVV